MEIVTKYKSVDGCEFLNEKACTDHENDISLAESIMNALPERPDSCDFSNGGGFIQHNEQLLLSTRNKFLEFVKRYGDHKWLQQSIDGGLDIDYGWAGRIIGECAPSSIYRHWNRFGCIDKSFREWGQPYYANNPDEAEQNQIN